MVGQQGPEVARVGHAVAGRCLVDLPVVDVPLLGVAMAAEAAAAGQVAAEVVAAEVERRWDLYARDRLVRCWPGLCSGPQLSECRRAVGSGGAC